MSHRWTLGWQDNRWLIFNLPKSLFCVPSILDYFCVRPVPRKIDAVSLINYSVEEARVLHRLVAYLRKCVPSYRATMAPISDLLQRDKHLLLPGRLDGFR